MQNMVASPTTPTFRGRPLSGTGALLILAALISFEAWIVMLMLGMFAGYLAIPGLAIGFLACAALVTMKVSIMTVGLIVKKAFHLD